jgi:hypothetical protein
MTPLTQSRDLLRLRLAPTALGTVMLDGCWWPASADPPAELPGLVSALDRDRSPVVRLLLSAAGWSRRPHSIEVAGRTVTLGYFSDRPTRLLTASRADGSCVHILVITPGATGRRPTGAAVDRWEAEGGHLATPPKRSRPYRDR